MKLRYLTVGKGKTKMKIIVSVVLKINTEGQGNFFYGERGRRKEGWDKCLGGDNTWPFVFSFFYP